MSPLSKFLRLCLQPGLLLVLLLAALIAGCNNDNDDDDSGGSAGGVNASLTGSYDLIYCHYHDSIAGPYTHGEMFTADIGADTLAIPSKSLSLSDPTEGMSDTEIIWTDSDNGYDYALSNNQTGQFNEINLSETSGAFLGQMTEDNECPDGSGPVSGVSGVAAVGAPINGADVELICEGGDYTATTDTQGAWTADVAEGDEPCLIKASGGEPAVTLYSYAAQSGWANITPFTTLALAKAVSDSTGQTDLGAYFEGENADPAALQNPVATSSAALAGDLGDAGYSVPNGFDAFTMNFDATPGDAYDDMLEAFAQALDDAGQTFEEFQTAYIGNAPFPEAPAGSGTPGGGNVDDAGSQDLGAGNNGITGKMGSNTRTFTTGVTANESVGGLISIMAFGAQPTDFWELAVKNETGLQTCNVDGVLVKYTEFKNFSPESFTSANNGDCELEVTKVATPTDNIIEGAFVATLKPGANNNDTGTRNVTRGFFRAPVSFQ